MEGQRLQPEFLWSFHQYLGGQGPEVGETTHKYSEAWQSKSRESGVQFSGGDPCVGGSVPKAEERVRERWEASRLYSVQSQLGLALDTKPGTAYTAERLVQQLSGFKKRPKGN